MWTTKPAHRKFHFFFSLSYLSVFLWYFLLVFSILIFLHQQRVKMWKLKIDLQSKMHFVCFVLCSISCSTGYDSSRVRGPAKAELWRCSDWHNCVLPELDLHGGERLRKRQLCFFFFFSSFEIKVCISDDRTSPSAWPATAQPVARLVRHHKRTEVDSDSPPTNSCGCSFSGCFRPYPTVVHPFLTTQPRPLSFCKMLDVA